MQLQTSLGNLNIEVHCDFVPRTAENFMGLCLKGFYDGLGFHRWVTWRARLVSCLQCVC